MLLDQEPNWLQESQQDTVLRPQVTRGRYFPHFFKIAIVTGLAFLGGINVSNVNNPINVNASDVKPENLVARGSDKLCAQVITYAISPEGKLEEFPDSCVPEGYMIVNNIVPAPKSKLYLPAVIK